MDSSVTVDANDTNKAIYEKYINQLGNGWTLGVFSESGQFYATREIPIFERVFKFYSNLIDIDHPNKIQDPENPNLQRYLRFENDPAIGWSLVGSGTKHKYLLYFNNQFPFVHQNFVNINLGTLTQLMQTHQCFKLSHKVRGKLRHQKFNSLQVKDFICRYLLSYLQISKSSRCA